MEPRGCCCCSFTQLSHCHDTTLTALTHIFFFLSSLLIKTTTMMMTTTIIICIHGCTLAALWSFFSAATSTTATTTTCCCLYYIFGERQTADTVGHLAVLCHRNPVCVVLCWESHPWDNHRPVIHFFDLYHSRHHSNFRSMFSMNLNCHANRATINRLHLLAKTHTASWDWDQTRMLS